MVSARKVDRLVLDVQAAAHEHADEQGVPVDAELLEAIAEIVLAEEDPATRRAVRRRL